MVQNYGKFSAFIPVDSLGTAYHYTGIAEMIIRISIGAELSNLVWAGGLVHCLRGGGAGP